MLLGFSQIIPKFGSLIAIRVDNNVIRRTCFVQYLGVIIDANRQHIKKGEENIGVIQRVRDSVPTAVSKIKFDEIDHEQLLKSLGCPIN